MIHRTNIIIQSVYLSLLYNNTPLICLCIHGTNKRWFQKQVGLSSETKTQMLPLISLVYTNLFLDRLWNMQLFSYVNRARIRSCNQPVRSNESKVSCSRKQRGPFMGLEHTTDRYPRVWDALPTAPRRPLIKQVLGYSFHTSLY